MVASSAVSDKLRFGRRRGHAQDRLVREHDLALLHCPDLTREAERRQQIGEEGVGRRRECGHGAKVLDIVDREPQPREQVQRLLDTGHHEEPASLRQVAHEQLERAAPGDTGMLVAGHHRQLIQVGREDALHRCLGVRASGFDFPGSGLQAPAVIGLLPSGGIGARPCRRASSPPPVAHRRATPAARLIANPSLLAPAAGFATIQHAARDDARVADCRRAE